MMIYPLGTNGFFPSFNRQTACYAVKHGTTLIIIDAGSGLFRLAEPVGRKLLEGTERVDMFISHYHLDHTFGFYASFKLLKGKKVTVYGMTEKNVFEDLTTRNYFPIDYQKAYGDYDWITVQEKEMSIDNYSVRIRHQDHRGHGSLAFRFRLPEGEFAYVTDSEPTIEGVQFVHDVPLLLHEHEILPHETLITGKKLEDYAGDGHVSTLGAALIAKQGNAGKLVLIHHLPFADDGKLKEAEALARSVFPKTFLAEDLKPIEF